MSSSSPVAGRGVCLALCMVLAAAAATGMAAEVPPAAPPADTADPQAPGGELRELDEILVEAERFASNIADAEGDFYRLYNELNDDEDFRMSCGELPMFPGSRIMTRVCAPGFLRDHFGAPLVGRGACIGEFYGNGRYGDGTVYGSGPCIDGGYEPPPRELLLVSREEEWARHMMKVIRSDERLQAMAGHLDGLHLELDRVKGRYVRYQEADLERSRPTKGDRKPVRFPAGPRTL